MTRGDRLRGLSGTLRAYAQQFRGQQGYVLSGPRGKRRYHGDARHAEHHPAHRPPQLLQASQGQVLYAAPEGVNGAQVVRFPDGVRFVKRGSLLEPHKELAASTVLGSLGFRVPGVDVVQGASRPAIASRSLGAGSDIRPYHSLPRASQPHSVLDVDYEPPYTLAWPHDPRDHLDQRLAAALVNDRDRNAGNVMYDEHRRRWDIDFGLQSEPDGPGDTTTYESWLWGLDAFQTEQLADNAREVLDAHQNAGHDLTPLLHTLRQVAHPDAESAFDWMKGADLAPYHHLGFHDPHAGVLASLRTLSPDLHRVVAEYADG